MRCFGFYRSIIRLNFRTLLSGARLSQMKVKTHVRVSMAFVTVSFETPMLRNMRSVRIAYQVNTASCTVLVGPSGPSINIVTNLTAWRMNIRSLRMLTRIFDSFSRYERVFLVSVCSINFASNRLNICVMLVAWSLSRFKGESSSVIWQYRKTLSRTDSPC